MRISECTAKTVQKTQLQSCKRFLYPLPRVVPASASALRVRRPGGVRPARALRHRLQRRRLQVGAGRVDGFRGREIGRHFIFDAGDVLDHARQGDVGRADVVAT